MVNIKSTISFDEFNAIVDMVTKGCFPDDTYSPAYYELMFRYALFKTFAPDYEIPELNTANYNEVWRILTNEDGNKIFEELHGTHIYYNIQNTINNAIEYRIKLLTSSPMSLTDIALSKLVDVLTDKLEKVNLPEITEEDIKSGQKVASNIESNDFTNKFVDTLFARGVFADKENKGDE